MSPSSTSSRPEPGLEVAQHLLVEQRELAVDVLHRLDVLGQELEPLEGGVLVPGRQPEPHVERVEQLEPDPLLLVEGAEQVRPPLGRSRSPPSASVAAARSGPPAPRGRTPERPRASRPAASVACSRTKPMHLVPLGRRGRMSILFTTNTIFLPHSRICSRKPRSLSVNGRSALVTNSTRSARGTKSRVSSSCRRMMALVPGVSTTLSSRSSSAG